MSLWKYLDFSVKVPFVLHQWLVKDLIHVILLYAGSIYIVMFFCIDATTIRVIKTILFYGLVTLPDSWSVTISHADIIGKIIQQHLIGLWIVAAFNKYPGFKNDYN